MPPELKISLFGPNQAYSQTTLIGGSQTFGGNSFYTHTNNNTRTLKSGLEVTQGH